MTEKDDNSTEDNDQLNFDSEDFTKDFMGQYSKVLKGLGNNPELIQSTIKNFMETLSPLSGGGDALEKLGTNAGSTHGLLEEILKITKRNSARLNRIEKRLEEAGAIKPLDE